MRSQSPVNAVGGRRVGRPGHLCAVCSLDHGPMLRLSTEERKHSPLHPERPEHLQVRAREQIPDSPPGLVMGADLGQRQPSDHGTKPPAPAPAAADGHTRLWEARLRRHFPAPGAPASPGKPQDSFGKRSHVPSGLEPPSDSSGSAELWHPLS